MRKPSSIEVKRELVAQLGIGLAELAGDAAERGVDGEAGLGADHQQVERVGQALADRVRCASSILFLR